MKVDTVEVELKAKDVEEIKNKIKEELLKDGYSKVRHAEWQLIHRDKNFIKDIYQCSECRFLVTGMQEIAYVYCPNCGARMDGGEEQ